MKSNNRESGMLWFGDSFAAKIFLAYCRFFPAHRGKRRICRAFNAVLMKNELPIRSSHGARLRVDPVDWIGRTIAFEGGYEPRSLALAAKIMAGGGVFVDVGCNFGLYTCGIGILPSVRCIAIDASFNALAKLSDNLKLNPGANVTVVNCALAGENQIHCFDVPLEENLGTTRVTQKESGESSSRFWVVGTTLDSVLKRVDAGMVKLLKIDVEGFEMSVFKGLDFNGRFRPANIIVECDPVGFQTANESFEFLVSRGYQPMTVEERPLRTCLNLPEMNVWFRDSKAVS